MIYVHPPIVTRRTGSSVCMKLELNGYEISIAADDSCGALNTLRRIDVRVFREDEDVTDRFSAGIEDWDAATLLTIMQRVAAGEPV
ncbi:hypothetical protein [Azospirillum himalayense]|uniref:Uncharacterized protein n=1 Tax=Azospirillum himalayense TaxID=654847 RepID=A0ABW0FY07_9PROT